MPDRLAMLLARSPFAGRHVLTWSVAVLGTIGTVAVWWLLLAAEDRVVRTGFLADIEERELAIRTEFEHAESIVRGLASFMGSCDHVSSDGFASYVTPILERHAAIQALSFNVRVSDAGRERFEAEMRISTGRDYAIVERVEQGVMVPVGPRAEYVAVQFIEPYAGNESALGFDVASEERRLEALTRARNTGELSVTAPITLVQEPATQRSVLAFVPTTCTGANPYAEGSHDGFEGFVVGVFRAGAIVERALSRLDPAGIDVMVVDERAAESDRVLCVHVADQDEATGADTLQAASAWNSSVDFPWGGRRWRVSFHPRDGYLAERRTGTPWTALLAGLLLTVLSASYISLLTGSRRRIEQQVTERTAALRRINDALETEVAQRRREAHELEEYRDRLENQVRERTAALTSANAELELETSKRRHAEDSLREREARLRSTVGAIADGSWDWNVATGEVYFSDSWLESLGYRRDEVQPHVRFWESIVHPDDLPRVREALQPHLAGRTPIYECENRLRVKSGEYRWNLDRGRVVARDAAGNALRMVGTDTDITERKTAEERRRRIEENVRETQKLESLGLLAGAIAHDFNNLLVGVLGNADLVLRELPPGSPIRESVEEVRLAGTRAAELTRQMLAYSGKASLVRESLDLAEVVREMAHLLESSISKKTELRLHADGCQAVVDGDPTQLRQVVMNLITNASDALGDSGGVVTVSTGVVDVDREDRGDRLSDVAEDDLPPGRYALLEVEDTGSGMDVPTVQRMFEPFFTTRSHGFGRGLGLAAVRGIVRGHHGTIRVDSELGRGTKVTVFLPSAHATRPRPNPIAIQNRGTRWVGDGTVLVVDDEDTVRSLVARVARTAGLTVLTAADGREAVEVFREHAADVGVVVLDVTMPRMDGLEAFEALRGIRPDVPIILASGYTEHEAVDRLVDARLADSLQKPFQVADLIAKLRRALEPKGAGHERTRPGLPNAPASGS